MEVFDDRKSSSTRAVTSGRSAKIVEDKENVCPVTGLKPHAQKAASPLTPGALAALTRAAEHEMTLPKGVLSSFEPVFSPRSRPCSLFLISPHVNCADGISSRLKERLDTGAMPQDLGASRLSLRSLSARGVDPSILLTQYDHAMSLSGGEAVRRTPFEDISRFVVSQVRKELALHL